MTRRPSVYAAPVYSLNGPTAEYEVVTELSVLDAGDNVLWTGTPGRQPSYRIPVALIATQRGPRIDPEAADVLID